MTDAPNRDTSAETTTEQAADEARAAIANVPTDDREALAAVDGDRISPDPAETE